MTMLNQLEKELRISYPETYKTLYANGMLDWGETGTGWIKLIFPKLKLNPPLLLFAEDIEIWDPITYKAGIAEIMDREVYDIAQKYRFVPIGKTGGGDLYVLQYDLQNGDNIPVTFFPHDECMAEVLANNVQDFIFRQLLEAVREIDDYVMFYEEEEETMKINLNNQLRTHRPYLTTNQIAILENIYARDVFAYRYKLPNGHEEEAEGLVTFEEVEEILNREIGFVHLNKQFDYTV